jgi:hypothetical protein
VADFEFDMTKDIYISQLESFLDYMITGINYNILTNENVNSFLEILALLNKTRFYENHLQEILLTSDSFVKKLITVFSFILNPDYYFSSKITNKDELKQYMLEKYNKDKFKVMEPDVKIKVKAKHENKTKSLITSLDSLITINPDLKDFINNYYSHYSQQKHRDIHHGNLILI